MTFPALAFGLLCALMLGALFHLWADGGLGRLLLYVCLSTAGFAAGQALSTAWNLVLVPVGPVDVGMAGLGSALFLGVGHWLSMVRVERSGSKRRV
jgi:hypothetical protein